MSDSSETKWEYQVEGAPLKLVGGHLFDMEVALRLKKLGEEGWEFVSFHDEQAYFKRRMASRDSLQSIFEE